MCRTDGRGVNHEEALEVVMKQLFASAVLIGILLGSTACSSIGSQAYGTRGSSAFEISAVPSAASGSRVLDDVGCRPPCSIAY